jgi:hypothetical protein
MFIVERESALTGRLMLIVSSVQLMINELNIIMIIAEVS